MTCRTLPTAFALALTATAVLAQGAPAVDPLGPGCGTRAPELHATLPVLGGDLGFRVDDAPPNATGLLMFAVPMANGIGLGGGCIVWIDAFAVIGDAVLDPEHRYQLRLPTESSLHGVVVGAQAVFHPSGGALGIDLSSALALTLGSRSGPLAGLPSNPGSHVAAIRAMAPGDWLDLGEPAPDPNHGRATGRSYTPRMAWSPELGGAFLTGEGQHGFVHPGTGRYIDDVWFYDLLAHRWRCVRPGSPVATIQRTLDADAFERTPAGALDPIAQLGHGYELVTWDQARQTFVMLPAPNTYWTSSMPQRLQWLGDPSLPASQAHLPWVFDAVHGGWEREPLSGPRPQLALASRSMVLQYLPSRERVWFWDGHPTNRRQVWLFDTRTHAWSSLATVNDAPILQGHGVTCHDPARDAVWLYGVDSVGATKLWRFDVASAKWSEVATAPTAPIVYTTAFAGLTYDVARDAVVLKIHRGGNFALHRFDAASRTWSAPVTPPAALQPLFRWGHANAFAVGELDVHVFHVSESGDRTGRVVVHRLGR